MKYMLSWSIPTGTYRAAVEVFPSGRAPMPEGLTSLGRWHALGSTRGWLRCESEDPVAVAQHVAEWAPMLEIEVSPVIGDEEAGVQQAAACTALEVTRGGLKGARRILLSGRAVQKKSGIFVSSPAVKTIP